MFVTAKLFTLAFYLRVGTETLQVEHLTQKGPALDLTYKLTELGGDKHSSLFFKRITNLDKTFVTLALASCTIKHFYVCK